MTDVTLSDPIILSKPVEIDGKPVTEVRLREPKGGDLRGIAGLTTLLHMDVGAIIKVVPRVSQPPLSGAQVADMSGGDLLKLGKALVLFMASDDDMASL